MRQNFLSLVALCGLVGLTGCNQVILPDMTTTGSVFGAQKSAAYEHTIAEKRPIQEAFLKLPSAAGNVIDLTERRHGNGVEQLIIYSGDFDTRGENVAHVRMKVNRAWPEPKKGSLKIAPPTLASLSREMRKLLPGVSMNTSNQLHTNAYGPFGYALGRASGNVNCIYGWQNMLGNGRQTSTLPFMNKQSDKPELSVRLRVCRHNASARTLVDLMRNLRIDADPSRAIDRTRVSWNAGPGGQSSLAFQGYEQNGYISDELVAVEPAPTRKVIKTKPAKVASKPAVRKKAVTYHAPVVPKQNHAAVPLPTTSAGTKSVVELPTPKSLLPSQVKASSKNIVPLPRNNAPVEPVVPKRVSKNGFASVPLPN